MSACGADGSPPHLVDPGPQVAVVAEPLQLTLQAADADGDPLEYTFGSATIENLEDNAELLVVPDGSGLFTWTPVAADLGAHSILFSVSDGEHETGRTVAIEVRGAVGEGSAPVFRKPLGEGLVHDLLDAPCIPPVDIEIHDPDDTEIDLRLLPPFVDGVELTVTDGGRAGRLSWCPDASQREAAGRIDLVMSADDGDNPPTLRHFTVLLARGEDCPSQRPQLTHMPVDMETLADPVIEVDASDDLGLLAAPIVYWSTEAVELEDMEPRFMELAQGDLQGGRFVARLPNPTIALGAGASAPLYYRISVGDEDSCFVHSPAEGVHEIQIVNPGGDGASACQPCSWDGQCGGAEDLCLQFGVEDRACGRACDDSSDCGVGFSCSPEPLTSVEGASGRQCIPASGQCPDLACEDDDHEPDDTLRQALGQPALPEGLLPGRRLCPLDEDWYRIELSQSARVLALGSASAGPVLDLGLVDDAGRLRASAVDTEAGASIDSTCVSAGSYALRVSTGVGVAVDYQLSYVLDVDGC
ncbi:MAG: Ig-like domain-containing protein [Myxococcota bacterium]